MEKYGVNQLRHMFLDFFESKGHLVMKSFSLVPHNDDSLLLINGIEAGVGKGRTKKAAEQMAAYNTILALREKEPETCS